MKRNYLSLLILFGLLYITGYTAYGQTDDPILPYEVPSQNLLRFNRFLINPTFSTVREDKSYINLLHRNQSVQFNDNRQNYFLSYSGRIGDRSGLGLSLYNQKSGTLNNFGVLANYAYGVKISDKINFTFGTNISYYNSGLDQNSLVTPDPSVLDPRLYGTQDGNIISFQPGLNLSVGKFDFGAFAENLFDYNLKNSQSLTEFKDKTFSGHLQYTHSFNKTDGVFEGGRVMPLARVRKVGELDLTYGGSLILDLPKVGWLQGGYDTFYGASAGAGFNLNKRLSLGYTMEKGLSTDFDNLGVTHEISFAYSFTPNLTEDRVMLEDGNDLVENENIDKSSLATNEEIEKLKKKLAENDEVLEELMLRQDSIESGRQKDLERRFNMVMKMVRSETNGERPDLEKRAEELFKNGNGNSETKVADYSNGSSTNNYGAQGSESANGSSSSGTQNNYIPPSTNNTVAQQKDATNITTNTNGSAKLKIKKFKNLDGVEDGYYLVANVYKDNEYLDKFVTKMQNQGFNADYIDNHNTGLKYAYLQRFNTMDEAVAAHKSNFDGSYNGKLWVMDVDSKYSNEKYAQNVKNIETKASKYRKPVTPITIEQDGVALDEPQVDPINLSGVSTGYYIIANVFANPKNAKRFVKLLNSYGLSASYFINPENNWKYVYLKKHQSWNNALISYYSKINDSYNDKMWIMRVSPNLMT